MQAAEQAGAQAVIERQDRRRLDPAAGQRRGGVGEQHAARLERGEQRAHRRQGQQPGRAGQRGELAGQVVGGDLPQRLIPRGPGGQRGLQDAQVPLDRGVLPGGPGTWPAALQRLGPGAYLGVDRRAQDGEPGRQPPVEGRLRAGPGQALVGEELHGPQRDQVPLVEELPEPAGVPGRLAEVVPVAQHGGHGAPGLAQRVRGPAAGLPVAGQRVQGRRDRRAGRRPGPGRPGLLAEDPGGAGGALARPARPGRADRLLPPAPGAGPHRVGPAEQPAGPAQPVLKPGQVPAVAAGAGDFTGLRIAAAAAARPQPHDLLAAVPAGPGTGGGPALAPLAPAGEPDRTELAAVRAGDQPGPRQPVAAGAQPGGQVRAFLPAPHARPDLPPDAGITAFAQSGLARPGPVVPQTMQVITGHLAAVIPVAATGRPAVTAGSPAQPPPRAPPGWLPGPRRSHTPAGHRARTRAQRR